MPTHSLNTFENQVSGILRLVNLNEAAAHEIKDSLIKSVYIDAVNQFLPELKKLNQEQSQAFVQEVKLLAELNLEDTDNLDQNLLKKRLEEIQPLIVELKFDFKTALVASAQKVLGEFVTKISTDLSVEEVEKIKAILS